MQLNVDGAKARLSRLLEILVPHRKKGLQLGAGRSDPEVNRRAIGGAWWKAMPNGEAEDFFEGR